MSTLVATATADVYWSRSGASHASEAWTATGTKTDDADLIVGDVASNSFKAGVLFDVSSIPAQAVVRSATLSLKVKEVLASALDAGEELCANRITATWSEASGTLTDVLTGQTGAIGAVGSYVANTVIEVSDAALVAIVQGWVTGTFTNFGLSIGTLTPPEAGESVTLYDREDAAGAAVDPTLTIVYALPNFQMIL